MDGILAVYLRAEQDEAVQVGKLRRAAELMEKPKLKLIWAGRMLISPLVRLTDVE